MITRKRLLVATLVAALAVVGAAATEVFGSDDGGSITVGRGLPIPDAVQHAQSLTAAAAARRRVTVLSRFSGIIAGTLNVGGGPPHRKRLHQPKPSGPTTHAVLVQRGGRTVKVAHTNSRGEFSVRVAPGAYALRGTVGADCQSKTVTVKANATSHVKLNCSIM